MIIGLPATRVGLDPGTANTLVYVKGRGVALNEPSLVTIRTNSGAIEWVGEEARAGHGRTPRKFQTARPIRAGVVADVRLFGGMIHRFLDKAHLPRPLHRLRVAMAVPGGMPEAERLALVESLRTRASAGVSFVSQVLAAARGAGLAMDDPRARMIVNIGAGVTDVAVIAAGSTVYDHAIRTAGDQLDIAIAAYVEAFHGLLIGEPTAERLKIQIGSAVPDGWQSTLPVKGRCLRDGVPREVTIRSSEVQAAILPSLERIAGAVREALEKAPPEVTADLAQTGIVLTGGSALLRNLEQFLSRSCGLSVRVAHDPLSCVIRGLAHEAHQFRATEWRESSN